MSTRKNGYWNRHPIKELQAFLAELHDQGWRIIDPPKYYKALCPCDGLHKTTIHLTPSSPNYLRNKRGWLAQQTCYKEVIIKTRKGSGR